MTAGDAMNRRQIIKDAVASGAELEQFIRLTAGIADLDGLTVEGSARRVHQRMVEGEKDRTEAHLARWIRILELHLFPTIGALPINDVSAAMLAEAIKTLWISSNVTAQRVVAQYAVIWNHAQAAGVIPQERRNITEVVDQLLPEVKQTVQHFDAMPASEVSLFYAQLTAYGNTPAALALRFLILTGTRSAETRGATWAEINLDADGGAVWTIPADRMKAKSDHRIALTAEAVVVLDLAEALGGDSPFVFPSTRTDRELSVPVLLNLIKTLEGETTVHGFRSTFRQWAAETGEDDVAAERFLAHKIKVSAVEDIYKRGAQDMTTARGLAQRWADFVTSAA
jgi:integrase